MIIGVDAGALSIHDDRLKVGVYRVTVNLLRQLGTLDRTNKYRLYTFLPIDRGLMSEFGPRMENVVVRPTIGWSMIQLPIELRRHPVDLFLGLSQMLPFTSARTIGFVYDLGFLRHPGAYPGSLKRLEMHTTQLVKRADHIMTISEVTKRDVMRSFGVDASKLSVAYPGVDARFTAPGPVHKEHHPYVLFVGALKRGKNVPFALRVFKKFLVRSRKVYDFLLVGGDYWADPDVPKTVKALGLEDRVKIVGFVPDRELPAYYRGAEVLLVTSLWEGFCLPAVEAMASGCPVVYANTGSLPEVVADAGLSFASKKEDEAVRALLSILPLENRRRNLVALGKKRAHQFTWAKFAKKIYSTISGT